MLVMNDYSLICWLLAGPTMTLDEARVMGSPLCYRNGRQAAGMSGDGRDRRTQVSAHKQALDGSTRNNDPSPPVPVWPSQ